MYINKLKIILHEFLTLIYFNIKNLSWVIFLNFASFPLLKLIIFKSFFDIVVQIVVQIMKNKLFSKNNPNYCLYNLLEK